MRKFGAVAITLALFALTSGTVYAAQPPDVGKSRVISVLGVGQVQGREALVDILAVVPPGVDEREVAANVLTEQGARPVDRTALESAAYTTEGWVWPQFFDSVKTNDNVTQNYNPLNDPLGGSGQDALTASENTWSTVSGSTFRLAFGGTTGRYPSLVRESPGPQVADGYNDVGWAQLSRSTLGVTWYMTSAPYETDMALNTNFSWDVGNGGYDKETVFLHENGHVVGLGHSSVPRAVMYAYYTDVLTTLTADDIAGIRALYPTVAPAADFTITASPTSKTIRAGQSAKFSVTLTAVGGYSNQVTLSVSGLPVGSTATFSPNPVTPTTGGARTTMTVTTGRTTSKDSYVVTITGTGEGASQSTSVTLTVK